MKAYFYGLYQWSYFILSYLAENGGETLPNGALYKYFDELEGFLGENLSN